jgi:hypothetical protein
MSFNVDLMAPGLSLGECQKLIAALITKLGGEVILTDAEYQSASHAEIAILQGEEKKTYILRGIAPPADLE